MSMRKLKVMIVDDDESIREALFEYVTHALDCETVALADVKSAIVAAKVFKPDLILTDFQMPELSGLDLVREIKAIMPHVSIVMMTAFSGVETAVEAMKLGAEDYLTKPFNFYQLDKLIQKNIAKRVNIKTLDAIETDYIELVIAQTGSVQAAAEKLGINASTIWRKRKTRAVA